MDEIQNEIEMYERHNKEVKEEFKKELEKELKREKKYAKFSGPVRDVSKTIYEKYFPNKEIQEVQQNVPNFELPNKMKFKYSGKEFILENNVITLNGKRLGVIAENNLKKMLKIYLQQKQKLLPKVHTKVASGNEMRFFTDQEYGLELIRKKLAEKTIGKAISDIKKQKDDLLKRYKKIKGEFPEFLTLFHARSEKGALSVSEKGILPSSITGMNRNESKQQDSVYLGTNFSKVKNYGPIIFKTRVRKDKLVHDDDFMHRYSMELAFKEILNKYPVAKRHSIQEIDLPSSSFMLNYRKEFDEIRKRIFNDFLNNPEKYKELVDESLKFGQIAHKGSIKPYSISYYKFRDKKLPQYYYTLSTIFQNLIDRKLKLKRTLDDVIPQDDLKSQYIKQRILENLDKYKPISQKIVTGNIEEDTKNIVDFINKMNMSIGGQSRIKNIYFSKNIDDFAKIADLDINEAENVLARSMTSGEIVLHPDYTDVFKKGTKDFMSLSRDEKILFLDLAHTLTHEGIHGISPPNTSGIISPVNNIINEGITEYLTRKHVQSMSNVLGIPESVFNFVKNQGFFNRSYSNEVSFIKNVIDKYNNIISKKGSGKFKSGEEFVTNIMKYKNIDKYNAFTKGILNELGFKDENDFTLKTNRNPIIFKALKDMFNSKLYDDANITLDSIINSGLRYRLNMNKQKELFNKVMKGDLLKKSDMTYYVDQKAVSRIKDIDPLAKWVTVPIQKLTNKLPINEKLIQEYMEVMATEGTLPPAIMTMKGNLIAGQNRIEAAKRLGFGGVPTMFITNEDKINDIINAQFRQRGRPRLSDEERATREAEKEAKRLAKEKERELKRLEKEQKNTINKYEPSVVLNELSKRPKFLDNILDKMVHKYPDVEWDTVFDTLKEKITQGIKSSEIGPHAEKLMNVLYKGYEFIQRRMKEVETKQLTEEEREQLKQKDKINKAKKDIKNEEIKQEKEKAKQAKEETTKQLRKGRPTEKLTEDIGRMFVEYPKTLSATIQKLQSRMPNINWKEVFKNIATTTVGTPIKDIDPHAKKLIDTFKYRVEKQKEASEGIKVINPAQKTIEIVGNKIHVNGKVVEFDEKGTPTINGELLHPKDALKVLMLRKQLKDDLLIRNPNTDSQIIADALANYNNRYGLLSDLLRRPSASNTQQSNNQSIRVIPIRNRDRYIPEKIRDDFYWGLYNRYVPPNELKDIFKQRHYLYATMNELNRIQHPGPPQFNTIQGYRDWLARRQAYLNAQNSLKDIRNQLKELESKEFEIKFGTHSIENLNRRIRETKREIKDLEKQRLIVQANPTQLNALESRMSLLHQKIREMQSIKIQVNIDKLSVGLINKIIELNNQLRQTEGISQKVYGNFLHLQNIFWAIGGYTLLDKLNKYSFASTMEMEQYYTAFETLFKSPYAAELKMSEIWKTAALTPFEMDEIAASARVLEAFGVNSSRYIKTLTDLAASHPDRDIRTLAIAFGRLGGSGDFGEAFERLRDFGIAYEDFKKHGLNFSGENVFMGTTKEAIETLAKIVEEKFSGMAEKQQETFIGRLSTFRDLLKQIGREITKMPTNVLKDMLKDTNEYLWNILESGDAVGIINIISNEIVYMIYKIRDVFNSLKDGFITLKNNWDEYKGAIYAVIAAIITKKIVTNEYFAILITLIQSAIIALRALAMAFIFKDFSRLKSILIDIVTLFSRFPKASVFATLAGAVVFLTMKFDGLRVAIRDSMYTMAEGAKKNAELIEKYFGKNFIYYLFKGQQFVGEKLGGALEKESPEQKHEKAVQQAVQGETEFIKSIKEKYIEDVKFRSMLPSEIYDVTGFYKKLPKGEEKEFEITAYSPTGNKTATGTEPIAYSSEEAAKRGYFTVAVDKNIIPLGTKIWIEGLGYGVAEDTGGAVKGNIIDVFFPDEQTALEFGRQKRKIQIEGESYELSDELKGYPKIALESARQRYIQYINQFIRENVQFLSNKENLQSILTGFEESPGQIVSEQYAASIPDYDWLVKNNKELAEKIMNYLLDKKLAEVYNVQSIYDIEKMPDEAAKQEAIRKRQEAGLPGTIKDIQDIYDTLERPDLENTYRDLARRELERIERESDYKFKTTQYEEQLTLLRDRVKGFQETSAQYLKDQKVTWMKELEVLRENLRKYKELEPKMRFAPSEVQERYQMLMYETQKNIEEILLKIKEQLQEMGSFNTGIKPITMYEYYSKITPGRSMTIVNPQFVFNVKELQEIKDIQKFFNMLYNATGQTLYEEALNF